MSRTDLNAELLKEIQNGDDHKAVSSLLLEKANVEDHSYYKNPLWQAVSQNRTAIVNVLLAARATVQATDYSGQTPLHRAVSNHNITIVNALLAVKANTEAADDQRARPLALAVSYNDVDIMSTLIAAKADIEAVNKDGERPLAVATSCGNVDMMSTLIAAKANIEAEDKDGRTPLARAVREGRGNDVMNTLIAAKASIEAKLEGCWKLLDWAVLNSKVNPVYTLLAAKANIEAKSGSGLRSFENAFLRSDSPAGITVANVFLATLQMNELGRLHQSLATQMHHLVTDGFAKHTSILQKTTTSAKTIQRILQNKDVNTVRTLLASNPMDLSGVSFVPVADHFSKMEQSALEKQGALFQLAALEGAVTFVLSQTSHELEFRRHARCLYRSIAQLLQAWQHNAFAHADAQQALDQAAVEKLMALEKNGDLELYAPLNQLRDQYVRMQKEALSKMWRDSKTDHKDANAKGVEEKLTLAIWNHWMTNAAEKSTLSPMLSANKQVIFEEYHQQNKLPDALKRAYRDRLKEQLLPLFQTTSGWFGLGAAPKRTDSQNALRAVLVQELQSLSSEGTMYSDVSHSFPIVIDRVIDRWRTNGIQDSKAATEMRHIANGVSAADLFAKTHGDGVGEAHTEIGRAAVQRLLQQYRRGELDDITTVGVGNSIQLILLHAKATAQQQQEAFLYLLTEWKAGRLHDAETSFLTLQLTASWKDKQRRLQAIFDPYVRIAELEAEVKRLQNQGPTTKTQDTQNSSSTLNPARTPGTLYVARSGSTGATAGGATLGVAASAAATSPR